MKYTFASASASFVLSSIALVFSSHLASAQIPGIAEDAAAPSIPKAAALMKKADEQVTIHLNSATPEQLAHVPGLNPSLAQAIIAARPFKSVVDLKNVKGITEPIYNKVKGFVKL